VIILSSDVLSLGRQCDELGSLTGDDHAISKVQIGEELAKGDEL